MRSSHLLSNEDLRTVIPLRCTTYQYLTQQSVSTISTCKRNYAEGRQIYEYIYVWQGSIAQLVFKQCYDKVCLNQMRFVTLMCMVEYAQIQVCSTSTSHCCELNTSYICESIQTWCVKFMSLIRVEIFRQPPNLSFSGTFHWGARDSRSLCTGKCLKMLFMTKPDIICIPC